jgi:hypothetical protein
MSNENQEFEEMAQFEDREKNFEAKFAHDETVRFKVISRRDKLVGLWAAEKLGLKGVDAEAYAMEVVKAALAEAGDNDIVRKLTSDFAAKGVEVSDHQISREIDHQMTIARQQIMAENS